MQVEHRGMGDKIPYAVQGSVIAFNEGELTLDLRKYERDFARTLDICKDKFGGLTMGLGENYAAQIEIPAREYEYEQVEEAAAYARSGENESEDERQPEIAMRKKALPLDMNRVKLILWEV